MKIWILNQDMTRYGIVSNFRSLKFKRCWNSKGTFELTLNANSEGARYIQKGKLIYLDTFKIGIIQYIEITKETGKANEIIKVSGIEIKDYIINSRITIPPSGFAYDEYVTTKTEEIVRQLIIKNCIDAADTARNINILQIAALKGYGREVSFSSRFKALETEVYSLLTYDTLGLVAEGDLTNHLVKIHILKGVDRTVDNTEGNSAALFSIRLGTLKSSNKTIDSQSNKNIAYAGGSGEGTTRTISQVTNEDVTPSGIARKEIFVDASDAQTSEELSTRGIQKLQDLQETISIDGQARSVESLTWAIGDFVTIVDNETGETQNKQINEVEEVWDGTDVKQVNITFGKAPASIGEAVKYRFKDVNNLLTK